MYCLSLSMLRGMWMFTWTILVMHANIRDIPWVSLAWKCLHYFCFPSEIYCNNADVLLASRFLTQLVYCDHRNYFRAADVHGTKMQEQAVCAMFVCFLYFVSWKLYAWHYNCSHVGIYWKVANVRPTFHSVSQSVSDNCNWYCVLNGRGIMFTRFMQSLTYILFCFASVKLCAQHYFCSSTGSC